MQVVIVGELNNLNFFGNFTIHFILRKLPLIFRF
jgi:hypothetical protein